MRPGGPVEEGGRGAAVEQRTKDEASLHGLSSPLWYSHSLCSSDWAPPCLPVQPTRRTAQFRLIECIECMHKRGMLCIHALCESPMLAVFAGGIVVLAAHVGIPVSKYVSAYVLTCLRT